MYKTSLMAKDPTQQYETTQQAARRLRINEAEVRKYCIQGRWPGAVKGDDDWAIPKGSHPDRSSFGPESTGLKGE